MLELFINVFENKISMDEKKLKKMFLERTEDEICAQLQHRRIPDLQNLREKEIKNISEYNTDDFVCSELWIKRNYPEYFSKPRIHHLPEDIQLQICKLAIPLSNFYGISTPTTWLTTNAGLEKLVRIFDKVNLPITNTPVEGFSSLEISGKLCAFEKVSESGISAPYAYAQDSDCGIDISRAQFVPYEKKIFTVSCILKCEEARSIQQNNESPFFDKKHICIRNEKITETTFKAINYAICEKHKDDVEKNLQNLLAKNDKSITGKSGRPLYSGNSIIGYETVELSESKTTILRISEPKLVYDPSWIKV